VINKGVKLIDCTLRDGGYYNGWDFSQELIGDYLVAMAALQVDFVEIGFRSLENEGFKGGCAYSTDSYLNTLPIPQGLSEKIGVMVNDSELVPKSQSQNQTTNQVITHHHEYVLAKLFESKSKSPVNSSFLKEMSWRVYV